MTTASHLYRIISLWMIGLGLILFAAAPRTFAGGEQVWTDFIQQGDIDQALQSFQQAVEENPQDHLAHAGLAMLIPSRSTENRDALDHWLQALSTGRAQPEAMLYLFKTLQTLSNKNDYLKALEALNQICEETNLPDHLRSMLLYGRSLLLTHLGRWDEVAQTTVETGLITQYWFCGPFDNAEESGHNRIFGPETALDLNASYEGRRKTVSWKPLPVAPSNGYIDLHPLLDPSNESTSYLVAVLDSNTDQSCKIHLGHTGAMKVWLNGKLLADVDRYHDIVPDQVNLEGHLVSGQNALMIKLSSGQKGKYGLYVRLTPKTSDSLTIANPSELSEKPDLTAFVPQSIGQTPIVVNYEPLSLQLLKAIGEAAGGYPHRPLFYALSLQAWQVVDENDTSVNTLISQLTNLFPKNPLLWRLRGESEKQENRQRLGYSIALQKDPSDQASFLKLLEYNQKSPFATTGLDLIREWSQKHDLPRAARFQQARILEKKGLKEAAIDLLRNEAESELGSKERMFLYSLNSSRRTDPQKREMLESILRDYPGDPEAIHHLFPILLRQSDTDAALALLEHERRINPLSTNLYLDLAKYYQTKNEFQTALNFLNEVKQICPDHFEAHRISAIIHHHMGDDETALVELQTALTTRPSDPWSLEYREFLQPDVETYASPYLVDWKTIQAPDDLDLSKANYLVLLNQRIVKVHPNGNSSETVREAIKILTETGIRYQQVRGVYYEKGSEEVRIIRARVWKPDGSFYDAPAPQRRSASSASDADQRLYEDYMVAVLQFQGLEKGAVLELEYEKKAKGENIFAEYFGDQFYVGDGYMEPTVRTDYVLITPKSREFYHKFTPPHYPASVATNSLDFQADPTIDESGSNRVWTWSFAKLPTIPREPLMPQGTEILPYIQVSTFQTWKDMTEWYWNLSRDQLIPGPIVQDRLAKVLHEYRQKRGIAPDAELSVWDKVRAINAFVNTEVRYLGLEFGIHGFKPHKVDEICNAQYGDCKDKAALAVAMLKELGVEAHMVILRTTDRGEINYELPMLGIFNHAIYYVPDIDGEERWIDGTATFFGASELPPDDAGSNSLIVKPGGDYEFKRIPHSKPEENGGIFTSHLVLDREGTAKGYRAADFRGIYNPVVRSTYENPVKAKEIIDRMLIGTYPGSKSSNLELSDLTDYATAERIVYEMEIPQFSVKQGNQWVFPSILFKEMMSQRYATLSQREYDLVLNYPWSRTYITTIELPGSPQNVVLPENIEIQNEHGNYNRKFEWNENKITIKEEILFKPVRVSKDQYPEFREFCRVIDHAQDEKIIYSE